MRGFLIVGALIGGGLLGAFAPAATSFDLWKTGEGMLSYNRLQGDCETLTHSFGRNAAWGLWEMPLADIETDLVHAADGSSARMFFSCRSGAECIRAGALQTTDRRLATHSLAFGSLGRAVVFETAITELRKACAAAAGG